MALRLIAASKTDVGLQREQNEDTCYTAVTTGWLPGSGLFIVADGMGGYHAGEVASRIAVETIRDTLHPVDRSSQRPADRPPDARPEEGQRQARQATRCP